MEDSTAETIGASVDKKIDSFIEEGLDHATEMLSALMKFTNVHSDIKAIAITSSSVSRFHFCLLMRGVRECSLYVKRTHRP